MLGNYRTIAEIREANQAHGYYWFSHGAMRSFKTRIESAVYSGKYFITSEDNYNGTKRLYSIRQASANGYVGTVEDFNKFHTLEDAREQVRAIVKAELQASNKE